MRKQQRIEAKARKQAEIEALMRRANEIARRIPPEFQDWGVTKTRAYCRLQEIAVRKTFLRHPPPQTLRECISELERHGAWTLERCAEILQLPLSATTIYPKK